MQMQTTIEAAPVSVTPLAVTPAATTVVDGHPDEVLFLLKEELKQAHSRYQVLSHRYSGDADEGTAIDKAYEAACDVTKQIEQTPAHTLEGLRVKAYAVLWCCSFEEIKFGETTDERLAAQIVRSLLQV